MERPKVSEIREQPRITLVFVDLLLGSWHMVQESCDHYSGPASGLLARGAGALAATVSLAGLLLGSWRMAQEPWRLPTLR